MVWDPLCSLEPGRNCSTVVSRSEWLDLQHDGYEQWMIGGSIVFLGTEPYYSTMVSSSGWLEISTVPLGLVSRAT